MEDNEQVIDMEAGLYAMVESLEDALPNSQKHSLLTIMSSKHLTVEQQQHRRKHRIPLTRSNAFLVPVDTIYEPIAAVPDAGGPDSKFLFIRPVDDWGFEFSNLLSTYPPDQIDETT